MPQNGDVADRVIGALDESLGSLHEAAHSPPVQRKLRPGKLLSAAVLLALVAFGVVMVATMLWWPYVALAVFVLAGLPLLASFAQGHRCLQVAAIAPVAVVVPVVALLGFDVVWSSLRVPRPHPAVGLVVAAIVIAATAYVYLRWAGKAAPQHPLRWALYAAASALGLAALTGQGLPDHRLVFTALATGAATLIYLQRAAGPVVKHPLWWALLLVGVTAIEPPLLVQAINGHQISRILLIAATIIAAVAGLNGLWLRDNTDRRKHAKRAVGIAVVFGVALPGVVFVFVKATSLEASTPHEESLPPAAVARPLPQVAVRHRPILLFDSSERFRTPLDVDEMLNTGDVELCPSDGLLANCRTVHSATDLKHGFGNLRFDTQQIEDDSIPTTIYAHLMPDQLHPGWTDIDYWWYLPDNPANTAQGAMCGAGLVIPEITCFDHQSDWEGATVVVDKRQEPEAVHYAAHNHVIDVPWSSVQSTLDSKALQPYAAGRDVADRPLVFVALGSHAAYPLPCDSSVCNGNTVLEDNRHDGHNQWLDAPCASAGCVTAFPRPFPGADKASWNAFDGYWGSAVCLAKVYCAQSNAPRAPGSQGRYNHPWCYDYATRSDLGHPRAVKLPPAECPK